MSTSATKPRTPKAHTGAFTVSYWWRCDSFPKGIPQPLAEALDESAQKRAFEMIAEGYETGELNDWVNITLRGIETPADGFVCRGWWLLKR